MQTRIETDTMGEVQVPLDRYWGAQTQRSLDLFKIGSHRMPVEVIQALGIIKKAAAMVNHEIGGLSLTKREIILKVCDEIIRRNLRVTWSSFARVDTVSPEILSRMKAAGCCAVSFGVESANAEILKTIRKGITTQQVENAVRLILPAPHAHSRLGEV